jgi:hypothetical protein
VRRHHSRLPRRRTDEGAAAPAQAPAVRVVRVGQAALPVSLGLLPAIRLDGQRDPDVAVDELGRQLAAGLLAGARLVGGEQRRRIRLRSGEGVEVGGDSITHRAKLSTF